MLSEDKSLKKTFGDELVNQLTKNQHISQEKESELRLLAYRNIANQNWISEAENLRNTIELIKQDNPYIQVPMFFFLSNGEGTTIKKDVWVTHALEYLNNISITQYELYDYPHNLYLFVYQDMAEKAVNFISKYISI